MQSTIIKRSAWTWVTVRLEIVAQADKSLNLWRQIDPRPFNQPYPDSWIRCLYYHGFALLCEIYQTYNKKEWRLRLLNMTVQSTKWKTILG